jgi:hypothetical protein
MIAILLLSTMLLALIGCTDTTPSDATISNTIPLENLRAISLHPGISNVFPTNNGRGVYVPLSVLYYFDFETEEKMFMCTQSGCKHNDTSCTAYLGGAKFFTEYGGKWYLIDDIDNDQIIQMQAIDPSSGKRVTLSSIPRGNATSINCTNASFAYGHAYLTVFSVYLYADGTFEEFSVLYRIDLETGEYTEVARAEERQTFRFLGASESTVMLEWRLRTGDPLSEEDYAAQYGQDADYFQYASDFYEEHTAIEFGRYDVATQSYTVLADAATDGYYSSGNPNICYDNLVIYLLGDDLMLYDLTDNTSRKLLTQENIVNYWLIDNKAFYIVNLDDACKIYYADLETGESTFHKNNGNTEVIHFGLSWETDDYFIGIFHGQEDTCWIKKTDFYKDDYSNVKRLT